MATEKEKNDASPKQEEDANPNEVEVRCVDEEGKGDEEVEREDGKGEDEDEEVEREDEKGEDEDEEEREDGKGEDEDEEVEREDGKGEDEDEEEREDGKGEDGDEEEEKTDGEESEKKSPRTPGSERPTRERKKIERLLVGEISTPASNKTLTIEKGQGTQLKDIPNVAFKLSKRKADENLQLLHNILFGKKAKVHTLKKNIGLFSGFVWVENKEKQRAKIQDKIDKCVREKLLDFCDVLNIPANKATTKKELSAKLLDFLESPHATTDSLLADKEKGKKRKAKSTPGKRPSSSAAGNSKKKQKLVAESGKKQKHSIEENKSESSESEDGHDDTTVREVESDQEELNSEEGTDGDETEKLIAVEESSSKRSGKKDTGKAKLKSESGKESQVKSSKTGTSKKASNSTSKKETEPVSKRKARTPVNKKKKEDVESEEDKAGPKNGTSSSKKKSRKSSKKEQGEQSTKVAEKQPTREEMHSAVADILKEVDFETATLSDILKQLEKHFGVNLIDRKKEVKEIITEVIEGMSDNEGEKTESEEESAKDGDDE